MSEREKLMQILSTAIFPRDGVDPLIAVTDYLIDNGVVPVIRCKDCAYLRDGLFCTQHHYSDGGEEAIMTLIQDKMYCGLGKKEVKE